MKKVIHQVYWDFNKDGVKLEDIKQFYDPVQKTKKYCKKHGIRHKMWDLKMCEDFVKKYFKKYYKFKWQVEKYLGEGPLNNCWLTTAVSQPVSTGSSI